MMQPFCILRGIKGEYEREVREMKHTVKSSLLGLLAASVLFVGGCSGKDQKPAASIADNSKLASNIREKYKEEEKVSYTDPMFNLSRDHVFEKKLDFDLEQYIKDHPDIKNFTQIVNVYADAEFKDKVNPVYEYDKETSTIQILPPKSPKFYVTDSASSSVKNRYDKGESKDWGNAQQYYMVQYMDLKSGEMLKKPKVTIFSVKAELPAPNVEFSVSDDGTPQMKWDAVKGADRYMVFYYNYDLKNNYIDKQLSEKVITDKTEWKVENDKDGLLVNKDFNMAKLFSSEDDVTAGDAEKTELKTTTKVWGVIAMNDKGTSRVSETFNGNDVASLLPYREALAKNKSDKVSKYADKEVGLLPSYRWIVMCDGKLSQRLITYDIDKAELKNGSFGITDDDGTITGTKKIDYLDIPYTIDGTAFHDTARIFYVNKKTYQEELKKLKSRQDSLRSKGGSLKSESNMQDDAETEKKEEGSKLDESISEHVYANSALGEYLAVNMLNGNTRVSLNDFKESSDRNYLVDAWNEAVYQNPLILGVRSIAIDTNTNDLLIQYDMTQSEIKEKQDAIKAEVKKVTKEIIKDDMSALDKEIAINDYLCKTAEYDDAALENAEKNNFKSVDASFNDSFNAYGILLNKKGVCASYAASFKLLADEAGLESIVVTGYLNGNVPHAWNRVNIDDQWLTIDSTNNDNEVMSNALFNLPDNVARGTLSEDKLYMMDSELSAYKADVENKEYYHLKKRFFDNKDEVVETLSSELEKNGTTLLRTDYNLEDEEFKQIAQEVMQKTGDASLQGTTFLGMIYLQKAK